MYQYDTVLDAITRLKERGYIIDFNIAFDKIICTENIHSLNPDKFEITEVYRFEGDTSPSDEDVVYAVESKVRGIKRVLTSAFGIYADSLSSDMIRKLSLHTH